MAKVEIIRSLEEEIFKKFKGESIKIFNLLKSLEKSPKKGKLLGQFAGFAVKELKYNNFRFYFIVDGYKLNVLSEEELVNMLMRFVRMSDKKHQQETIDKIRKILINIGPKGFDI